MRVAARWLDGSAIAVPGSVPELLASLALGPRSIDCVWKY